MKKSCCDRGGFFVWFREEWTELRELLDSGAAVYLLLVLLVLTAIALMVSRLSYRRYRRRAEEEEYRKREASKRRYVTAKMKERVLERDNATCRICGISREYLDSFSEGLGDYLLLEIDHKIPVKQGGSGSDESNLQVLCWRCNRKKSGTRTNEEVAAMIDYGIDRLKKRRGIFRR